MRDGHGGLLPERTLTLLLVRHGLTSWNAEGRLQGHSDIPLSREGREQACRLGRRLSNTWQNTAHHSRLALPVAVYVSDLSRAHETALLIRAENPALSEVPLITTPLLRERGFGVWEGLTAAEAAERFGPHRSHGNEGEPHAAVRERLRLALEQVWDDAFADAERREAAVLFVGHGGSLRHLVGVATNLGPDAFRHFRLSNTGLSIVELQGAELNTADGSIHLWNDTSHLDDRENAG